MESYATTEDLRTLWRPLSKSEEERAAALLPVVSDSMRQEARNVGRDLDEMIAAGTLLEAVVRSVAVDVTARALMTPSDEAPLSQMSQSALGYTISGTYLIPGGGLFIKRSELARLGLLRQRVGVISLGDPGNGRDAAAQGAERNG